MYYSILCTIIPDRDSWGALPLFKTWLTRRIMCCLLAANSKFIMHQVIVTVIARKQHQKYLHKTEVNCVSVCVLV